MDVTRKLPIGVQSFEKLISNGYLYVDKTAYIWGVLKNEEKGYAKPYLADPRRIQSIGVNFSSQKRNIEEWKMIEMH